MDEPEFRAYIAACSDKDWATVRTYFEDDVVVDDERVTADGFVGALGARAGTDPELRLSIVSFHAVDDTITAGLLIERSGQFRTQMCRWTTQGRTITAIKML